MSDVAAATLCPKCGADTGPEYRFCIGCGESILAGIDAPTPATSQETTPWPATRCAQCGADAAVGDRYCVCCGTLIPEGLSHTGFDGWRLLTALLMGLVLIGGFYLFEEASGERTDYLDCMAEEEARGADFFDCTDFSAIIDAAAGYLLVLATFLGATTVAPPRRWRWVATTATLVVALPLVLVLLVLAADWLVEVIT